jgi:hypothetical protein
VTALRQRAGEPALTLRCNLGRGDPQLVEAEF